MLERIGSGSFFRKGLFLILITDERKHDEPKASID